ITGLIISAGLSSRMGKFKPLILLEGKSFLENIVINLQPICKNILIVTGHNSEVINKHITESEHIDQNKIQLIYNPNYEKGMFTSLQTGLNYIDKNNWVLYHLVDQPNLPKGFYKEFVEQVSNKVDWIQPIFNNRKGHPIVFNSKVINSILDADSNKNLRIVSSSNEYRKKYWECDYKEVLSDFDTPEDLENLID
ncbi:MAG: nucleotidyltransferase family protein, partial [Ignavibacteriae bacterium]|nr:nucleotidyltransferase family protein [Ignavibacteriota bacterium]